MRWAREHPEQMAEIARLPLSEQPRALRDAVADHDERMREAQTIARLELTRDGRGEEAYPAGRYCPAFATSPTPCPLTPQECEERHVHHAPEEDAHLEADYEDRQNGGE